MKMIVLLTFILLPLVHAVEASGAGTQETARATNSGLEINLDRLKSIAPPPRLSDRQLGLHPVSCLPGTRLGVGEVEGEDYVCGVFTVPQNWEEPDGNNLDLRFLVAKATGKNPQNDPLLSLAGGPGQSSTLAPTIEKYRSVRSERDIIFFDIRGSGVSQRLGVEECLVLALQNGAPTDQIEAIQTAASRFLAIARGEEAPRPPDLWDLNLQLLNETCWHQFAAQGIDLNQFTTAVNARDAVELLNALGYDEFNIEGVSYGTRLAMTIMDNLAEYEKAPRLRSVILDSTFPPSVYLLRTIVRSDHDFILQILDECQNDSACGEAFPNLEDRLAKLLKRLELAALTTRAETVTLAEFVEQVTNVSGTRAGYLPRLIAELEAGELSTYLSLRNGQVGTDLSESLLGVNLDLSDPVQAFINEASALLDDQSAAEFSFYVTVGLVQEDPLKSLKAIIEKSYPGAIGNQMLEMLKPLTPEVIANSPYVAQQLAAMNASEDGPDVQLMKLRRSATATLPHFLYTAIHCSEDILHERYEDAVNSFNDLRFPQLTNLKMAQAQAGRCVGWPMTAAPVEVKDPVNSDVPTVILQGSYDSSTPIYMGMRAHRELQNSTYILVPQQGHGTWNSAKSCVGQIAAAFVQNPETEVDPSCLNVRRPQWALPSPY